MVGKIPAGHGIGAMIDQIKTRENGDNRRKQAIGKKKKGIAKSSLFHII